MPLPIYFFCYLIGGSGRFIYLLALQLSGETMSPTNPFGTPMDNPFSPKPKKKKRESIPAFWKEEILIRQNNKCAGKRCAKIHNGKKLPVNVNNNFDHIKALGLGGKHIKSNIQALCPGCHSLKSKEDAHKMAQAKKKKKKADPMAGMFGLPAPSRRKSKSDFGLF